MMDGLSRDFNAQNELLIVQKQLRDLAEDRGFDLLHQEREFKEHIASHAYAAYCGLVNGPSGDTYRGYLLALQTEAERTNKKSLVNVFVRETLAPILTASRDNHDKLATAFWKRVEQDLIAVLVVLEVKWTNMPDVTPSQRQVEVKISDMGGLVAMVPIYHDLARKDADARKRTDKAKAEEMIRAQFLVDMKRRGFNDEDQYRQWLADENERLTTERSLREIREIAVEFREKQTAPTPIVEGGVYVRLDGQFVQVPVPSTKRLASLMALIRSHVSR